MSILPRPGSLFAAGDTLPIDRYFMKCRLRYISFFAVGIDSRYLAIVSVLGPQSVCHVLKILPNALRVSDVLQEQIIVSSFYFYPLIQTFSSDTKKPSKQERYSTAVVQKVSLQRRSKHRLTLVL